MIQHKAQFRFYEELNDFLPSRYRKKSFTHSFEGNPAIKDTIEAIGVPHTEIDLILVNGQSVDFSYSLQDGDSVAVYPVFESIDISPIIRLRPKPLREIKFILDVHLGKLTRLLRMFGFDSYYQNDYSDEKIVQIALAEKRIILTCDRGILKRKAVTHGYWIRESQPDKQVSEVIHRFDLKRQIDPFSRCLYCNARVEKIDKDLIIDRLPAKTKTHFQDFVYCAECDKIYWQGTHYEKMAEKIARILDNC